MSSNKKIKNAVKEQLEQLLKAADDQNQWLSKLGAPAEMIDPFKSMKQELDSSQKTGNKENSSEKPNPRAKKGKKDIIDKKTINREDYAERFTYYEIEDFIKNNITPERANSYPERVARYHVNEFILKGITPEIVDEYDDRFESGDIKYLTENKIKPELANKYDARFDAFFISWLLARKISPEVANAYDKKFSVTDIESYHNYRIKPEDVKKLKVKEIAPRDLRELKQLGYTEEMLEQFDERFYGESIPILLVECHCFAEKANQYDKIFKTDDIMDLWEDGIWPEIANSYTNLGIRFEDEDELAPSITSLVQAKISPEQVKEYTKTGYKLGADDIIKMISEKIMPDELKGYNKRFEGCELICLIQNKCPPEAANSYPEWLDSYIISGLHENRVPPEIADKYDKRFMGWDYPRFARAGISPELANKYVRTFAGYQIALLYALGFDLGKVTEKESRVLKEVVGEMLRIEGMESDFIKLKFIGIGSSALVVLKDQNSFKLSTNIREEYGIIRKINEKHKGKQKNIVVPKSKPIRDIGLELKYIQGDSLEQKLRKENKLSANQIIKYSTDIMNGLVEMRRAGVFYHRDIRPANILIDEENDRAVIIDLGIATTDRHAHPKDNRRYGGPNDLVSLGQVMYKMATGEHIFAESKSMETTIYARKLKDHREWIYEKPEERLQPYLQKIDEKVKDERVATAIKTLLQAKRHEYKKMHKILEAYAK